MRVSIVTPSYNQASFLEQTICSVLDSAGPASEYFVMDGGSTDSSVEIIKKYSNRLTGCVSEKDQGQADAINKGLRKTTGEIVAWLNSDDYYLPGAIERASLAFEQNPQASLVYGDVFSVDAHNRVFNVQKFRSYDLMDLLSFNIISQPGVFIRRSALDQVGLLDPSYHCLLDHHLWLRLAHLAPIVYIPETLAAARYHVDAKNLARPVEFGREAFRIVDWMKSSDEFGTLFVHNKARVLGGANRFDAYYLLEAGLYTQSLTAYGRAFRYNPAAALKDWHRIVYALLALAGLKNLRAVFMRMREWRKGM